MQSLPAKISPATQFDGIHLSRLQHDLPDFDLATPMEPDEVTWAEWAQANPQAAEQFDRKFFNEHVSALLVSLQNTELVRPLGIDEIARYYGLAAAVSAGQSTPEDFRVFISQDRLWIHEDTADVITTAMRFWDASRERHAEKQVGHQ